MRLDQRNLQGADDKSPGKKKWPDCDSENQDGLRNVSEEELRLVLNEHGSEWERLLQDDFESWLYSWGNDENKNRRYERRDRGLEGDQELFHVFWNVMA